MEARRFLPALTLLPILTSALGFALPQSGDAAKIIELGRSDSRVMEHLDHLANRIGPRLTGSDGLQNACVWTREQFESFGLKNCRLEQWGEFPVGFNRGPATGRMVTPEQKELHFGTNAWTAGTSGPVLGLALLAPTNDEELTKVRSKLKGAWIIAPAAPARPERGPASPVASGADGANRAGGAAGSRPAAGGTTEAGAARGPGAGGSANPPVDREFRDKLDKLYESEGIAGTIRAGRGDLILTGGNSKVAFDKLPTRPSITLLAAEHKEICERLKAGDEVKLEFDIRNWFEKGPIALNNVIAEIPGSEKPDEVVIVGGHIDSWDGATGTTDNGTGCATTMEAARLLVKSGVKPKRTIRFMLWSGEEQGLLGSAAYVKAHKAEMAKISAVLVHDGGTNYCAGITATPPMVKPFEAIFAPVIALDSELPFKVSEVKGLSGGGSDHSSFLSADVPGFFWSQRGKANYNHTHHTQFDTYDQAIPLYQQNSAIVIAVGALGIANLPELLSRENLRAPGGGGFGGRRLGVQLADDMTIEEVVEDGMAAKIGLQVGDKIVKVGDTLVADSDAMRAALREGPAKTKVVVQRKGKDVEAAIEFSADAGGGPGGGATRRLGIRLGEGLAIDVITPGGTADQAGFVAGDKIVKVGDKAIANMAELSEALTGASGETKVVVERDGKQVTVQVTLAEAP
ncbi:MAG: M20/M25/M40 family metallo-hydrolase [Planctomycetota bacterium]